MKALRALMITEEVKERIHQIVAYSSAREHWFDFQDQSEGWLDRLPGNNSEHVCHIVDGYRCVYSHSYAKKEGRLFRHLSVGVDGGSYPGPEAVLAIARLFGFTGDDPKDPGRIFPQDWAIQLRKEHQIDDKSIIVLQEIPA